MPDPGVGTHQGQIPAGRRYPVSATEQCIPESARLVVGMIVQQNEGERLAQQFHPQITDIVVIPAAQVARTRRAVCGNASGNQRRSRFATVTKAALDVAEKI